MLSELQAEVSSASVNIEHSSRRTCIALICIVLCLSCDPVVQAANDNLAPHGMRKHAIQKIVVGAKSLPPRSAPLESSSARCLSIRRRVEKAALCPQLVAGTFHRQAEGLQGAAVDLFIVADLADDIDREVGIKAESRVKTVLT